jgi:hypothetical protein
MPSRAANRMSDNDDEKMVRTLRRVFASVLHMDFEFREIEELIEALDENGYKIVPIEEEA